MLRLPRRAKLFPYTTLFRSGVQRAARAIEVIGERRPQVSANKSSAASSNSATQVSIKKPETMRSEIRSEEHTSHSDLVCRLLLEKKKKKRNEHTKRQTDTNT